MSRPIVYSPRYNVTMFRLERMHPFDAAKYGKVFGRLKRAGVLNGKNHHVPKRASDKLLLRVHSPDYLRSLNTSRTIAAVAELPALGIVPSFILKWRLLTPMRYATAGTVLAAQLALQHGWAINLGGGFHHAKADFGTGFCYFADINIAAKKLWDTHPKLKIMVIDLDAHQGNGFEATFAREPRVRMLDVYNTQIFPQDAMAKRYIHYDNPIMSGTKTEAYLELMRNVIPAAIEKEKPECIIYNAGTDIYAQDPLGQLAISRSGIIERDELVFTWAKAHRIPIVMVLSGGYTPESAFIIADSIVNLDQKGLLP